jgi:hypothetical protein
VLLPGPAQATQVGQNCGKLRGAELGQAQERAPSGQVVMRHDFRELSSYAHTLRMPDPPVASDSQAPELSATGLLGTSARAAVTYVCTDWRPMVMLG